MFLNDSLHPYVRLGAIDQEAYIKWVDLRFSAESSKIYTEHQGVRSLLKRKDADSRALSREIWEIELIHTDGGDVERHLLDVAKKMPPRALVTCLCASEATELLVALQNIGAVVRGANVSWGFSKKILSNANLAQDSDSRPVAPPLRESFQACVESSFKGYRSHYHVEGSVSRAASEVYISSICASVDSGTEAIVTLDSSERVVAFSTIDADEHREINEFLGANLVGGPTESGVCKQAQKGGWYSKNIRATLSKVLVGEHNWYVFGTAANNFAIQKTWINLGLYHPLRFAYRLHWQIGL